MKAFVSFLLLGLAAQYVAADQPTVFCYWSTTTIYRNGIGAFGASDISTELCTHVMYAFIGLDAQGNLTYDEPETSSNGKSNNWADVLALTEQNPDIKIMVSVGGWNEGSEDFSAVANSDTLRASFITNLINFVLDKGFHGIDIDWEYPAQRGGADTDKEAFIWLLRDLRTAVDEHGLLLTAAVGVTASNVEISYDVENINKYLDLIVLMTYDFHGSWDSVTGVNSPLYRQETDAVNDALNVNASVNVWLDAGADASKLLVGIGGYGRTFTLTNKTDIGTGAGASGAGVAGIYTREAGVWAYYEICTDQQANASDWSVTEVTGNYAYASKDTFWVGYDNPNTMYAKGKFAQSLSLAGVGIWSVDLDDFSGQCGEAYPLLGAAVKGYKAGLATTDDCTCA